MSLRIWLPLTGNLNNNGLEETTVTNYNATVSTDGKIGSCYSFDGSSSYIIGTQNFLSNNTSDWSFCCWMKVNNAHNGCLFSARNSINNNGIAIFYYNTQWIIDDGVRWQFAPTITINANTWYHVCVVRKKGIGKYLYINGALDSSTTTTGTPTNVCTTNFAIGNSQQTPTSVSANWLNGYLNDVRFYDHALSIREIKEISKALIVHYPLNGILPLNNIVRNEQYMPYNNYSKVGHTATVSGNTGLSFNGCKVWRLTYTPTSTNLEHVQTTLHGHGIYVAQKTFKADTKYCFWILWRAVSHPDTVCGGVASNIGKWTEIPTTKFNDEWNIVGQYRDGTVTVDKTDGIFTSFKCPSATADTPIIIDFCCPHLVEGYDYILDEDDYQDNFAVYDTSGYSNNTILYNNITNGDPIRYNKSTYFNGTDAFIACGRGSMVRDAITINFWAYMDDWTTLDVIASCTESGGYGFGQSSSKLVLWLGTGQSSNTYKNASSTRTLSEFGSGWHMITGTYDGFSTKLYVDGVLEGNNTAYTTKTPLFYNANNGLILGGESTGSQTVPESGRYTECNLSDFRVYATALSIDDIKELYNTPINISDNGDLSTQGEFLEGGELVRFGKNGVVSASGVVKPNLASGTNRGEVSSTAKSVSDGMLCYNSGGDGVCSVSEDITVPVGKYSYNIVGNTTGNRDFQQRAIPYKAGKSYTGSWWAKGSGKILYRVWDVTAGKGLLSKTFNLTADWAFYSHTFEATQEMEDDNCTFHLGVTGVAEIHLCGMKLEENDHPTPWTYNNYDAGFDIDNNFVEENNPTIGNQNYITAKELKEI